MAFGNKKRADSPSNEQAQPQHTPEVCPEIPFQPDAQNPHPTKTRILKAGASLLETTARPDGARTARRIAVLSNAASRRAMVPPPNTPNLPSILTLKDERILIGDGIAPDATSRLLGLSRAQPAAQIAETPAPAYFIRATRPASEFSANGR